MDCDPPDYYQIPAPIIKLKSSDGEIFPVEVKVAKLSLFFKEMLDQLGVEDDDVLSIPANAPEITGAILSKIIQWANHHKDDPITADDDDYEKEVKPTDNISNWDAKFLQVDQTTLFQMIRAANYLNVKGLLQVTCKILAKMIKGKSLEEVRQRFLIQNDFSRKEEVLICRENSWCEEIDSEENNSLRSEGPRSVGNILVDLPQNVDNEGQQLIQDCLTNNVVLRKIFQHFTNPELVKFSSMNKLWCFECRTLLKKRGNVMARLACDREGSYHRVFEFFGLDLQQMDVVPYSGIAIAIFPLGISRRTAALDPTYQAILDRLELKHFAVKVTAAWRERKNCPELLLVKKLFQAFSGTIEKLTLDIDEQREEFFQYFVPHSGFPSLQVLKLQEQSNTFSYSERYISYNNYMRTLVSRAPQLQEVHTDEYVDLMENVLEGSKAVLVLEKEVRAPFDNISESLIAALRVRLTKMEFFYDEARFSNRITRQLLQASCATLCSIKMDAMLALQLMSYRIQLETVRKLKIHMNYSKLEYYDSRILRNLHDFDFTYIFPSLKKVQVLYWPTTEFSPDHLNQFFEQADAVLSERLTTDRAANVQELEICQSCYPVASVAFQFFAHMCPSLKKKLNVEPESEVQFGSIWEHWVDLEEIHVKVLSTGKLDSVFLGIFLEEVAELKLKDEEYLKTASIVPVMPAFTCLRNCRVFNCTLREVSGEPELLLRLTVLIAFARRPALAVSLNIVSRGVPPESSHLEPFASITVSKPT